MKDRTDVNRSKTFLLLLLLLALALVFSACGMPAEKLSGTLTIEDGTAKPMLRWSDRMSENYTNEGSDILRFCVYVETDYDTDNDGLADLVKVFAEVPRPAAEGVYQAGVIYDPTPYGAGVSEALDSEGLYEETPFDFQQLYQEGQKRTPAGKALTLDAAKEANSEDWNYMLPDGETEAYFNLDYYDYYLVRGFAVVTASGIGTFGSEGFELCGMDLERDSHKCVVEWLAGNRKAYTDRTQNIEIEADWCNGNVAMAGTSYGGTIPFEVATTGVEGLKTILPTAGIASWYDYTNSQGIPLRFAVHYTDTLAAQNCGGVFTDPDWTKLKPGYGSYLYQVSQDEEETNGDYAEIWDVKNYADDYAGIQCSALITQGLNDYNVTSRHADLMMQAFQKAGKTAKLVLHQEEHVPLNQRNVNGELFDETVNRWLCHYLYGTENGAENMAEVTVQSNVDGSWKTYDSWRDFDFRQVNAENREKSKVSEVSSAQIAAHFSEDYEDEIGFTPETYYISLDGDKAATYSLDLPENTTIFGVPEIHVKLAFDDVDKDGLMITAVLADRADDGQAFPAFFTTAETDGAVPLQFVSEFRIGGGHEADMIVEPVLKPAKSKIVTYGWTDLLNPGCGPDSEEYTLQENIPAEGEYYDYTFYMMPTVYTLAPGHHLELILTTWDPFRVFLDEDYFMDPDRDPRYSFFTYGYTVDNDSLKAMIPVK